MFKLPSIIIALLLSFNAIAAKSPHGTNFSIKCDVCHNPDGWTFKTTGNTFDHSITSFPLTGQHKAIDCKKCHTDLVFSSAKTTCISCHKDMHQQTVGQDCERCHTPRSWVVTNIVEVHRQSRFPLNGQHAQVDCYQCHKSASLLRFDPMGTECADCHTATFTATTNPSHVASKFPKDCFLCHNEKGWQPAKFNHSTNTTFPLTGGHIGVTCASCHASGYAGTATDCASCHLNNYNATTAPAHAAAKFTKDCITCHTTASWTSATFNHNTSTTFPLTGGHIGVSCISCHSKGYAGTSTDCVSCHLANYNATKDPSHATAKFPTDCKTCHTSIAWKPSTFNHNTSTTFPLAGAHIAVSCISCHAKGYVGTSTDCVSCHLTNYNATTNPSHVTAKYSTDCKTCHSSSAWVPSTFNHNTNTAFPLTGRHIGVSCISCHSKGYVGTSADCVSCHLANYNATTNPSHVTAKYSTDCKTCHTSAGWVPSSFNHNTSTAFPLTGSHVGVSCISCHSKGYTGTSALCESCHLTNYNATTNPSHVTAKFPTDCKTCHTSTAWAPSTFNHNTSTTFPLTGSHIGVSCISCHSKGYVGTLATCASCHLTDYNATTNPAHATAKFSTDCKTCHTSTAWKPSTFNHTTGTTFPIVGAHIGVSCISCHSKGYVGISTDCYSCHVAKYNATTNPAHAAAKFPTTCLTCHTQNGWTPSTYNHDAQFFPINSGKHKGQWTLCSECHTNATNYAVFNCLLCHAHSNKASVDADHKGKSGYVYNSTNCFSCHPRGTSN